MILPALTSLYFLCFAMVSSYEAHPSEGYLGQTPTELVDS